MNTVVRYSVVRFRPFVETGEFANIGIIAIDQNSGRIAYKLAPRRLRRVTNFFNDIEPKIYSNTVAVLRDEFKRLSTDRQTSPQQAFDHLVQTRESIVIFSEARAAIAKIPLEDFVEKLFERNVMRAFVTPEYRETLIARDLKTTLKRNNVLGYTKISIDDDIMPLSFDIASTSNGVRVIKPLAFVQRSTIGIMDHGAQWRIRLSHLLSKGKLEAKGVLLPIDPAIDPTEEHAEEARRVAVQGLADLGIKIIDLNDTPALIDFAMPGSRQRELSPQD